jgi:tetratricopeptide (TPR) repeat protein
MPWIALAFALDGEGLYDEAFAAVDSAMSLQPGAQIVAVRGAILIRSADFDGHERMARELLRSGGADAKESALWSLALAQRTQGRPREALETTRQLYSLAARPSASPADLAFPRLAEAQALFEAGHLREAASRFESIAEVEIVNQSIARNARHRAWLLTLAAAPYAELQDTTRLRTLADSVQHLGSLSAYARDQRLHHHIRGLLLRVQGRYAEAAAEFRKSLFSPVGGYTRTNLELARSLIATDQPDEAIAILEEALRGPVGAAGYYLTRTEIHELLAQALSTAGRNDEAVPHLRWVVAAWGDGEPEFAQRAERAQQKIGAGSDRIRQHGLPENRYLSVVRSGAEAQ